MSDWWRPPPGKHLPEPDLSQPPGQSWPQKKTREEADLPGAPAGQGAGRTWAALSPALPTGKGT